MKKSRNSTSGATQPTPPQESEHRNDAGIPLSPRRSKRLAVKSTSVAPTSAWSAPSGSSVAAETCTGDVPAVPSSSSRQTQQHQHLQQLSQHEHFTQCIDDKPSIASSALQPAYSSEGATQQQQQQQQQQSLPYDHQTALTGLTSRAAFRDSDHSGLWGVLPDELVEVILKQCSPMQLGMLESTCTYFHRHKLIEKIAKQKLKLVPRARGLKPMKKERETYVMLLQYVACQSQAAAQATSVACGAYHTSCLLVPRASAEDPTPTARHALSMFGRGFHGQLGNQSFDSQKAPCAISLGFKPCQDNAEVEEETMPAVVACGAHHSTSISRKGELYSWGMGCNGELGLGRWGPIELSVPRQCSSPHMRIVSVACGANHTLAIAETGTLWSCGRNRHGQLGTNTMVDGSRLQMVLHLGGYRVVSAAAGTAHSMALASDGSLFTWGDGSHGQLGHSQLQHIAAMMPANNPITMPSAQKINRLDPASLSPENRVTAISAGAHHSMALTVGGAILAFGQNSHGQLGTGDQLDRWKPTRVNLALPGEESTCLRVVQLACGAAHSVALFSNQGTMEVRTAGCNSYGQLGLGDRVSRMMFTPIKRISNVVAVQAGDEHSCTVTSSGDLYLWGRGDSGQLGMSDNRAKWKPCLLKDHLVVHPDKTLRRNKRNQPFTRPISKDGDSGPAVIM